MPQRWSTRTAQRYDLLSQALLACQKFDPPFRRQVKRLSSCPTKNRLPGVFCLFERPVPKAYTIELPFTIVLVIKKLSNFQLNSI